MPDQSSTSSEFLARPPRRPFTTTRFVPALLLALCAFFATGCPVPGIKRMVTVPSLVAPTATADTAQLFAEINRLAEVRSIRGKVDVQFLDTSFAKCGVAEKYSTADGDIIVQRPGQVYVSIKAPFIGTKIAEMTSDGERFRVAVLQGEERFRRFVQGTNAADYERLQPGVMDEKDCGNDDKKKQRNQQRTVSALSGLRPQHFTDALLVRPAAVENTNFTYARSEFFQEEADDRTGAKRNSRIVRGYYLLDEITPNGNMEAMLLRRFWFDRSEKNIRLARLQTYDAAGQLVTDVLYKNPQSFGDTLAVLLPARLELTRPQERYAIRITYQTPAEVIINRPYEAQAFVLQNQWELPEVDLDKE